MTLYRIYLVFTIMLIAAPAGGPSSAFANEQGAQTRTQERSRVQNGNQDGSGEKKRLRKEQGSGKEQFGGVSTRTRSGNGSYGGGRR